MNHSQQDDLIQLFQRGLELNTVMNQQQQTESPYDHVVALDQPQAEKQHDVPVHYISSHYTGTAHVRPDATSEPSRSPPPSYQESVIPEAMASVLIQNSIDPSSLLPNQVHLFEHAGYGQRLRLLELWRISPPSYPLEAQLELSTGMTSIEREEAMAAARYEQQMQRAYASPVEEHRPETYIPQNFSFKREPGEPAFPPSARLRAASIASSRPATRQGDAEPYIINMYAADQAARAVDPVFAGAPGLWQVPSLGLADALESQCGMVEQVRNHADWERMNERIARERLAGTVQGSVEDVMMM